MNTDTDDDPLRMLRMRKLSSTFSVFDTTSVFEATNTEAEISQEATIDNAASLSVDQEEQIDNLSEELNKFGEEIRRMGRELFRSNRTSERNQEIFTDAIEEIRRLESIISKIPAQYNNALAAARYEAKAEMCRELIRLTDTLDIELKAVHELINRHQLKLDYINNNFRLRLLTPGPVYDIFTDSLNSLKQLRDGRKLQLDRIHSILYAAGLRGIETTKFNPQYHRAISSIESPDHSPGTIIDVDLKGYMLDGRVLRYAEVIISK